MGEVESFGVLIGEGRPTANEHVQPPGLVIVSQLDFRPLRPDGGEPQDRRKKDKKREERFSIKMPRSARNFGLSWQPP